MSARKTRPYAPLLIGLSTWKSETRTPTTPGRASARPSSRRGKPPLPLPLPLPLLLPPLGSAAGTAGGRASPQSAPACSKGGAGASAGRCAAGGTGGCGLRPSGESSLRAGESRRALRAEAASGLAVRTADGQVGDSRPEGAGRAAALGRSPLGSRARCCAQPRARTAALAACAKSGPACSAHAPPAQPPAPAAASVPCAKMERTTPGGAQPPSGAAQSCGCDSALASGAGCQRGREAPRGWPPSASRGVSASGEGGRGECRQSSESVRLSCVDARAASCSTSA